GNLANTATLRRHCLVSIAGVPLTIATAATPLGIPVCAVALTPSPIVQCPATPTCPARITFLPISVDPARPTCAHSMEFSPVLQLWPTCTRLSSFVLWPIRVSPRLARSMQELAWISTSSSITTLPDCGILYHRP